MLLKFGEITFSHVSTIRLYFPILRKALSLGSSQPWQNVMKILTGQRKLSMAPLQRFFKPLLLWLKDQNKEENIGWARSCPSILPQPDVPSPLNHPHKYLYVSAVPASHLFLWPDTFDVLVHCRWQAKMPFTFFSFRRYFYVVPSME